MIPERGRSGRFFDVVLTRNRIHHKKNELVSILDQLDEAPRLDNVATPMTGVTRGAPDCKRLKSFGVKWAICLFYLFFRATGKYLILHEGYVPVIPWDEWSKQPFDAKTQ